MDIIRKGNEKDIPRAMELIKELAEFENGLEKVSTTLEQMESDGFGDHPVFEFYVAELEGKIIGLALYYYRYSTWNGRQLYLEDLIVTEEFRGKGYGTMLFDKMIQVTKSTKCSGMMWQVLDWNESAIAFYKKKGADFGPEWVNCQLAV